MTDTNMTATRFSSLDADTVFQDAADKAGLANMADGALRSRFRSMVARFDANGPIPAENVEGAIADLQLLVTHRLMLERDWRTHPSIEEEKIFMPIFVVGSPRTGTTLLQCLLAEDDDAQMLRYWQSHYPSPPPHISSATIPGRIYATSMIVDELITLMPAMLRCHPYLDAGGLAELEDEEFFTLDFHSTFPFHFLHVPNLPVGAAPQDPVAAYQFHKRMLQHFQWKGPSNRWVCKGTTHQFVLPALWKVYPDAVCIWPHRDPIDFIGSTLEMISIIYGPITGRDYHRLGQSIYQEVKSGYEHVVQSAVVDDDRLVHLRFKDLMDDPISAIRLIYDQAGLDFTSRYESKVRTWLSDPQHRSNRHGRFSYSIGDFGISPDKVRKDFDFYYRKFGLQP